jgi:hypothetical protein
MSPKNPIPTLGLRKAWQQELPFLAPTDATIVPDPLDLSPDVDPCAHRVAKDPPCEVPDRSGGIT